MIYFISNQVENQEFLSKCGIEVTNLQHVIDYFKDKEIIAIDTETEGFFDFINKTIMLQIGDSENQFVIDVRGLDIRPLKMLLEDRSKLKLLWNAKFDYKFIKKDINALLSNIYDGMIAEAVLTNGKQDRSLSLNSACKKYLGFELDKEERNKFTGLTGAPFTVRQIKYGARDVEVLPKIKQYQDKLINLDNLQSCVNLENRFVPVLADIEYAGFYLDADKWISVAKDSHAAKYEARDKLDEYVVNYGKDKFINKQMDLFSDKVKSNIKWSSSKQVIEFLKDLGVNTLTRDKKTGEDKDSCEAKHVSKYKKDFDFIPLYLDYKEKEKAVSTYGKSFLNNINPVTGRIHSDFWQILNTGRISSNDPNIQNIPREGVYRGCFTPQEGNLLVISDFSAQEPRCLADVSQDKNLIEFFTNGDGDIHSFVASKMYSVMEGKPVKVDKSTPEKRQVGKVLNLKLK